MKNKFLALATLTVFLVAAGSAQMMGNNPRMDMRDNMESNVDADVQNLEEARERLERANTMISNLQDRVQELEQQLEMSQERRRAENISNISERQQQRDEEQGRERNATNMNKSNNGTSGDRGPSEEARENINGTPGSEQARENRPGFVNQLLQGLFG